MSRQISHQITKPGQINLPGITAASKKTAEELLKRDVEKHHCFFRPAGLHNHTPHHILAAYDFGATPALLEKIYNYDAKIQRPILLDQQDKEIVIDESNWAQHLGTSHHTYNGFVDFFSKQIAEHGISATIERFIFEEDANKDGRDMLIRMCSGAVHPLIQIGYGAEFGMESLVVSGLAQACSNTPIPGSIATIDKTPPAKNISLLELLRRVNESEILKPPPYNPSTLINHRFEEAFANGGTEELQKLCSLYHISDTVTNEDLDKHIDEIIWVATILLSATGKKGRKPRLDFFFVHLVTSSLFIRPSFEYIQKQEHKAILLRTYVFFMMSYTLARGRPKIDPGLAMSYSAVVRAPQPSGQGLKPSDDALGSPLQDEDFNPWPELIQGAFYHPESHVVKSIRSLAYFAARLGTTAPGGVPGAWRDADRQVETHPGVGEIDGTLFVRTAGTILNTLGWCGHGQKEGTWDMSALGWDEAWENED